MKHLLFGFIVFVASACCTQGHKPTIEALAKTIKDARTKDYETGRVKYSEKQILNDKVLQAQIERFMDAENNAATALGKERPFPEVKKAAAKSIAALRAPKEPKEEKK